MGTFSRNNNLGYTVQDIMQITGTFQRILDRIDVLLKLYNDVYIQNVLKHTFSSSSSSSSPIASYQSNQSRSSLALKLSKTYIQPSRKFIDDSWNSKPLYKQKVMTAVTYKQLFSSYSLLTIPKLTKTMKEDWMNALRKLY